jgi:hypothetical protein
MGRRGWKRAEEYVEVTTFSALFRVFSYYMYEETNIGAS